ncbi:Type I inositol polyphosphate 5-phosphatase 13 [Diplonema papillatum]|nr:Type I inositol polyphosphate 5-phosphatase 13 [Diplonema papillatum]|eukprot:gene15063-22996_t
MEFVKSIPPEYKEWDMNERDVTEESLVESQMLLHDDVFTVTESEHIVVCSWNVNQKKPESLEKIRQWMQLSPKSRCRRGSNPPVKKDPAVIAIGLQEVDMSANAMLREETDAIKPWLECFRSAGRGYDIVAAKQLAGLVIAVLVRKDMRPHTQGVATAITRCGAMGNNVANKGGVAVRLQLHRTTLCFTNAHLAAHQNEVERRNRDFTRIVENQQFEFSLAREPPSAGGGGGGTASAGAGNLGRADAVDAANTGPPSNGSLNARNKASSPIGSSFPTTALCVGPPAAAPPAQAPVPVGAFSPAGSARFLTKMHDHVFFFGDLNYRIDLPYDECLRHVAQKSWPALLCHDQLHKQKAAGEFSFHGFSDATPAFAPTYKYDSGTRTYDSSEKKRVPAWTDRVLWYDAASDASTGGNPHRTPNSPGLPPGGQGSAKGIAGASGRIVPKARADDPESVASEEGGEAAAPAEGGGGGGMELVVFENDVHMLSSDHRAVYGVFRVGLKRELPDVKAKTKARILGSIRKMGLDRYSVPNLSLSESCLTFGHLSYGCRTTSKVIDVTNNGPAVVVAHVSCYHKLVSSSMAKADVHSARRPDPESRQNCVHTAHWLSISPLLVRLNPGETRSVTATCCIDKQAVLPFAHESMGPFRNPGGVPFTLSSWYVLAAGPQRFWIEATAEYTPSCFGSKLTHLTACGLTPISQAYMLGPGEQPAPATKPQVPKELWILVDFLAKYGAKSPNLFREDLSHEDFDRIREHLDNRCTAFHPSQGITASAVSQALLVFLQDLQEPVIPVKFWEKAAVAAGTGRIPASALPAPHFNSLTYVVAFLRYLLRPDNRQHNELTAEFLAQGFAPALIQRDPLACSASADVPDQDRLRATAYILNLLNDS